MNLRPPGYEPGKLPTALLRTFSVSYLFYPVNISSQILLIIFLPYIIYPISIMNMTNIREFLLSNKRQAILGVVGLVILVLSIIFFSGATSSMVTLYSSSDESELRDISTKLSLEGENYKIEEQKILVPEMRLEKIRIMLAEVGLPKTGSIVGYEIFNKTELLGNSNFYQNVNLVRALEGELSRTIASFDKIKNARVHLVVSKKEIFARDHIEPTASVILNVNKGADLNRSEINAISYLVASSIPNLKSNNITIVSTTGTAYKLAQKDEVDTHTDSIHEHKKSIEMEVKLSVDNILNKIVGFGKSIAEITVMIDMEHELINSEVYNPDQQVVRSMHTVNEQNMEKNLGDQYVSVATNIPNGNNQGGEDSGTKSSNNKTEETVNYEISKSINKIEKMPGKIKQLFIGIAVDGEYDVDATTGNKVYKPRTKEFLDNIKTIVISAIGVDESRGDVINIVNMQFSDQFDWNDKEEVATSIKDFFPIFKIVAFAITVLLGLYLVIKQISTITNKVLEFKSTKSIQDSEYSKENSAGQDGGKVLTQGVDSDIAVDANNSNMATEPREEVDLNDINATLMNSERMMFNTVKDIKNIATIEKIIDKNPDLVVNLLKNIMNEVEDARKSE